MGVNMLSRAGDEGLGMERFSGGRRGEGDNVGNQSAGLVGEQGCAARESGMCRTGMREKCGLNGVEGEKLRREKLCFDERLFLWFTH